MAIVVANLGSILLCAALAALLTVVTVRLIRRRRADCSGCGCGCSGCAMRQKCPEKKR